MIRSLALIIKFIFFISISGCSPSYSALNHHNDELQTMNYTERGQAVPTVYYTATVQRDQQSCQKSQLIDLVDVRDKVLAQLCKRDYDLCRIQGSCVIKDGPSIVKSLNFHTVKYGKTRFAELDLKDCPFGYGVKNICLDPYYSIAADLNLYKTGDVIFIEKVKGAVLPNGQLHNGYFVVRDQGGGIDGFGRFDFFTGMDKPYSAKNTLSKLGLADPDNRFTYVKVTEDVARIVRQKRIFPKTPEKSF
ncbi:MAG: 3D domain-containing protein [Pseudobdellovibrionaceae bacterium]